MEVDEVRRAPHDWLPVMKRAVRVGVPVGSGFLDVQSGEPVWFQ
jgi:hypothetical protein